MKAATRAVVTALVAAAAVMAAGCASLSTINERAMSLDDIIAMSEAGAGPDVIIGQIEATRSRFKLAPGDIVALKKAGVDDRVVEAMIHYDEDAWQSQPYDWEYWATPYDALMYGPYRNYPYSLHGYGLPYIVHRKPGLVGRFHTVVPVRPYNWWYYKRSLDLYDERGRDAGDDDGR